MKKLITALLCALLCLPMVAGAASTPISQTPDAGTLTGAEKIPIGRVGGTTAISTTTGALLNRANHTGTQAATTVAEDSTHRFATDAEKSAWNAKQDAYSVLTTPQLWIGAAAGIAMLVAAVRLRRWRDDN